MSNTLIQNTLRHNKVGRLHRLPLVEAAVVDGMAVEAAEGELLVATSHGRRAIP